VVAVAAAAAVAAAVLGSSMLHTACLSLPVTQSPPRRAPSCSAAPPVSGRDLRLKMLCCDVRFAQTQTSLDPT